MAGYDRNGQNPLETPLGGGPPARAAADGPTVTREDLAAYYGLASTRTGYPSGSHAGSTPSESAAHRPGLNAGPDPPRSSGHPPGPRASRTDGGPSNLAREGAPSPRMPEPPASAQTRPLGSFIDEMRAFHTLCGSVAVGPDARLLWFQLFLDINEARWPEALPYKAAHYAYSLDLSVRRIRDAMKELVILKLAVHHGRNQKHQSVTLNSVIPMAGIVRDHPITVPLHQALGIPSKYTAHDPGRMARFTCRY